MLKQRVVTAVVLLILFSAALFLLPAQGWFGVIVLIAALAGWEWAGLSGLSGRSRVVYGLFMGGLSAVLGWQTGLSMASLTSVGLLAFVYWIAVAFWCLFVPLWLRFQWRLSSVLSLSLLGPVVIVPAALALAQLREPGAQVLLYFMALVWVADIAAYFSGRRFGKHKLAPTVSPGKTWEGAVGAALGVSVLGALGLQFIDLPVTLPSPLWWLPILFLLTAISIIGDLFESLMKRKAGIKDSSQLLPGHGGVLDRIDSLTSTLPFAGLLLLSS